MYDISGESLQIELGDRETPEEIELQELSTCCKHTDWNLAKHTHVFRRPRSCNAHVPELGKYHDSKIGLAGYAMVLDADICDLSIADFIRGVRFPQSNTSLKHTAETLQSEVYCPKQNTYLGGEKPHVYRLSSHLEHSDLLLCNQSEKIIGEPIPNRRGDQEHEPSSQMSETAESLAHLTGIFGLSSSKELNSDAESHTDSPDSEQSFSTSQSINLGLREVHSALSWSSSNSESISHSRRGDRPRPLSADSKHVRNTRERHKRTNKSDAIEVLNWLRKGRKFEGVQDYNTQAAKAARKFPSLSLINPERIWRAKSADLTRRVTSHSSVSRSSIRSSIGNICRSYKRAPDTQSDSYLAKILQEGYCSEPILRPEQRDQVIRLERSSLRQWLPSLPSGLLSPHTDLQSRKYDTNSESLCKGRSQMSRGQNRSVKRRDALSKMKSKTDTLMKSFKKCSSLAAQSRCYKKQKSKLLGGQGRAISHSHRSPSVVQGLLRATSRLTVERNEEMQYPVVDSQLVGSVHIPAVSSNPLPSDSISISPLRVNETPHAYPLGTMIPRVSEVSIKEEKGGGTFYHAVHVTHPQSSAMGEVWKVTESQQSEGSVPSGRRSSVIESKPEDHRFQPTRTDPSMKKIHEEAKRAGVPPNRKQTNEQTGDMLQVNAETTNGLLHLPKDDEPNKAQLSSLKIPHISGVQLRSLNRSPSWYSENSMQERWPIFFSFDEGLFSRLGRTDSFSSAQGAHELANEIELSPTDRKKEYKRTLRTKKMQDPLATPENTMGSLARVEQDRAPKILERKEKQPGGTQQVREIEQPGTIRNVFPMVVDKIIGQPESQRLDSLDAGLNIKKPPFKHKPASEHTLTGHAITEPFDYREQVDETFSEEDDTEGQQTISEGSSENSADLLAREALGGRRITEGTRQPVIRINEFDAQNIPSLFVGPQAELNPLAETRLKRDLPSISGEAQVPPITARPRSPQAIQGSKDSTDSDSIEPRKLCCFKKEPLAKTRDMAAPHGVPMTAKPLGVKVIQEDPPLFQKHDDGRITGKSTYSDFNRRGYLDCLGKNTPAKRISADIPLGSPVATTTTRVNRDPKGPPPSQKHHVKQITELNSSPLDRDQPVALLSPRPVRYIQRKQVTREPTEKDTSPASNFVENTTDVADPYFDSTPEYRPVNNFMELRKPGKTYNQYVPETDALPRRLDFYKGDPKSFPGLDWYDDDSMQERIPIFLSLEEDRFSQLDELESVETPQTVRTSICDNELLQAKINPRIHARLAAPNRAQHKGRMMYDISSASESTSGILVTARPVSWKAVDRTVISDASEVIDRSGTHHSADSPANRGLWQRDLEEGCSTVSELLKNQHDDHPPTKTSGPSLPVEKRKFVSRYTQTDHVCIVECKCKELGIVPSEEGSSNEPELVVGAQSKPVRYNVETNYNARLKPQWKSNKGNAESTDGRFKQNQPVSSNETFVPVTPVSPSSQKAADQTEACTDSDSTGQRKLWCFRTNKPTKRTAKDVPMDHEETNIPTSAKRIPRMSLFHDDSMQEGYPTLLSPDVGVDRSESVVAGKNAEKWDVSDVNRTVPKQTELTNQYQKPPGKQPRRISRYTQADFGCIANCGCTKQAPGSPIQGCMESAKSAFDKKTKNTVDRPDRIKHDVTQIAEEGVNNPVSKTYESHLHSSSNLRRASHPTSRKEGSAPPEGQLLQRHSSSCNKPPVPAVQQQRTSAEIPNKTVDHMEQRRESRKRVIRHPINSKTIADTPVLSADFIKKPLGGMKESSTLAVTKEAANLINDSGNILHNRVLPNSAEQISDRPAESSPPLVSNGAPLYPLSTDQNMKFQQLPLSSSDQYPRLPIDKLAFTYMPLTNALMFQPPTGEALTWTIHSQPLHSTPYSTALVLGEQVKPESSRVFELQPVCLMSYCGQPRQLSPVTVSLSANTTPMTAEDVEAMNRTGDPTVCYLQPKLNGSPSKPAENVLQHRSSSKDGPRDLRTSIQTRSPVNSTFRATGCLPFLSKLTSCNTTSQRDNPKVDMSNTVRHSAGLTSAASAQKADFLFDTNDGQVLASISLDENAEKIFHFKHQVPVQAFNSDRMNHQNKLSFNSTGRLKVDVGHQATSIPTNQVKMSPSQPTVPGLNNDQKHEADSHVAATRNEYRESAVQLDGIRGVMGVQLIPVGYISGFTYPLPVRALCLSTPPACCNRCCVSNLGMNTLCDSSVQPVCHYSKAGSGLTTTDLVLRREQPSRRCHCNPNQRRVSSTPHQTAVIPIHINNPQQDGATEVLGSVFSSDVTNVQPAFIFCPDYQLPNEGSVNVIPREFRKTDRTGLAQDALIYVACGKECRGKRHYTRENYGDCRECCQCCKHTHRCRPPSCPVSMRRKDSADLDLIKTNYQLLKVEKKAYFQSQMKTRRNISRSPSGHKYPMFCQAPCLTSSHRVNCPGDRSRRRSPEMGYLCEHKQRPHYKHDRRVY
ncbi:hypothetical protein CRM22_004267 [Opisthorchis felineus]|uniref:Uncharacterized protein n=1 Tax=Opisthorchis felineus TaxID=147828 RepID=A0A4S2M3K6_OPIFE|nr:hypothetical protein CRM22_004267 [Opisthorchis felineus]